ncbi:MAG TPA: tetratricopeptide repeat protein [Candidatus Kapabacteria bacterium]|nr:tetratricopeptide repeat protein [Candidatus Kapabacteria bacterium]
MKKIIILILLFIGYQSANSQWAILRQDADSLVKVGSDYIYDVQFDKAEQTFNELIKRYPSHPAGYFLDAMVAWWKITLFRNTNYYDKSFEDKIQRVIDICDDLLDKNPKDINALFFKAGAKGYRGRYYAQKQEWVSAASDGSSAYSLMIDCQKMAPGNHDIMLGIGLYNYFSQAIPEMYPITKPLLAFLPKGDKQLGLYQLRAASRMARYAAVEARVILLQIYYSFEKDNDLAESSAEELFTKYPNNAYFHRYLARILVRKGKYDEFEQMWRDILVRVMDKKIGYDNLTAREAMYYIGTALYRKNDFNNALRYLLKAEEGSKILDKDEESGFFVNLMIYIANIYEKQNNKKLAASYYKKCLSMKEYDNSHRKANEGLSRVKQ